MSELNPQVMLETSMGNIQVELFKGKAPISVRNFLSYIKDSFYDGLIFHRVIKDFMVQGGGMNETWKQKNRSMPSKTRRTMAY